MEVGTNLTERRSKLFDLQKFYRSDEAKASVENICDGIQQFLDCRKQVIERCAPCDLFAKNQNFLKPCL